MSFVAAKCPQCGGDLQLDSEKETGFCMHCGSKIIIQEAIRAVRVDNSHMVETWMKMGRSALEAKNNGEAYSYFTKVVEVNPEDWRAIFYKAYAAGLLSTPEQPRINEFMHGIKTSDSLLDNSKLSPKEIISAKNLFPPAIIDVYTTYVTLVEKKNQEIKFDWLKDRDRMSETRSIYEKAIENCQMVLQLIEKYDDEISNSNKIIIKQEIVEQCSKVCAPMIYYKDAENNESYLFGYSAQEKTKFVNLYDDLVVEIRNVIPGYKKNTTDYVDRLSMPPDTAPHYDVDYDLPESIRDMVNKTKKMLAYHERMADHFEKAKEAEKQAEKLRAVKETAYQKQKYWDDHPEEYKTYLAEIEEKKVKAKKEISEKSIQVEGIKENIDELRREREKLGIFAGSQKKIIDEKVRTLEQDRKELTDRIEVLK